MRNIVIIVGTLTAVILIAFLVVLFLAMSSIDALTILEHSVDLEGEHPVVIGTARNDTDETMIEPRAEVKWYDAEGKVLYTSGRWMKGRLDPGEVWNFAVIGDTVASGDVVDYEVTAYD